MTVTDFLHHWSMTENPFRGEEARSDTVFSRMSARPARPDASDNGDHDAHPHPHLDGATFHSDFEKILGDLKRPASSVVFGEKGSGKTAIRLQISRRVAEHNFTNPGAKVLLIGYDDLNAVLDRLHERIGGKTPLESLQRTRLVDHMDAMLYSVVPRVVDSVLGQVTGDDLIELPSEGRRSDSRRTAGKLDRVARRDLLLLQALYDRPDNAPQRTIALRRRLRVLPPAAVLWGRFLLILVPLLLIAGLVWSRWFAPADMTAAQHDWTAWALVALTAIYAICALKLGVWDRLRLLRTAHRIRRQIRINARGDVSYARSLRQLGAAWRDAAHLPLTDSDDPRYSFIERLRRVLRCFGYSGMMVVVDRVDEPTMVSGDPDRMKAVIWPLLNNKFLQQEGVGLKLLLPMELRHAVFRESSAFFQEARLDKQSLIEHLAWTGPMLFDLCNARMAVCKHRDAPELTLLDLFAEDVTRQDLVEALDRLHQPRDAFKMMYRCITEHCAGVTKGQNEWKVPRHVLMSVVKSESARVQDVYRGIRPG